MTLLDPHSRLRARGLAWAPVAAAAATTGILIGAAGAHAVHPLSAGLGVALLALGGGLGLWVNRRERAPPKVVAAMAAAPAKGVVEGAAAEFRAVLEALDEPVLLIAGDSRTDLPTQRLVYGNAAGRRLFRAGREAGPLVTAVRDPKILEAVAQALFEGTTAATVYESGGAHARTWRARAVPIHATGERRLAMLWLRDETEMRRSERMRADFLANVSHELRTPLASLTGFIETLRGHARNDEAARDRFLGIMQGQAARMARLIEDLMSLSRIELNEHVPPRGQADLGAAVSNVVDALEPMAAGKSVRLAVELPDEPALAEPADRDQMVQVIQNLAENAIKYAPAGSAVRVQVRSGVAASTPLSPERPERASLWLLTPNHPPDQRYVALRVSDDGPGVGRGHLPRLTERFYRVEGQRADRSGTGLGLAIVKHIVNRHRGGLAVESALGEGASFTVYLPSA